METDILLKESRFSRNTGSTFFETIVATNLSVFLYILVLLILNHKGSKKKPVNDVWIDYTIEYCLCILPQIFLLTVFNDFLFIVEMCLLLVILVILFYNRRTLKLIPAKSAKIPISDDRLPSISNLRSVVNITSVFCILGADFSIFPEKYLKTEIAGYGLMDIGVGMYMITYSITQSHFQRTRSFSFMCKKSLPFAVLGIGRFLSTSAVNYHHPVTEYGVQWNFFLTLFVLTIINEVLFQCIIASINQLIILIVLILFIHQGTLSLGLQDWIVSDAPRSDFISSNREGLCSLPGYLILYLFGIVIKYYLPRKGATFQVYLKSIKYSVLGFIISTILTKLTENTIAVSRRTANAGFIFWITSFTFLGIIMAFSIELLFRFLIPQNKSQLILVPPIMMSVNYNPLTFFLTGNILTGLINIYFQTLTLSKFVSVFIISIYMFLNCSLSVFLLQNNIRLR